MFFFLSQYCIRMTNLLALVGLYCDLQNQNYMWRSCKNYVYNSTYIVFVHRHYLCYIPYDSMSGLHYNIGLRAYNHTYVFMHTTKIYYLIDTVTDSTKFFGFVDKIKLSRLSTYRRSVQLFVFHFNVYPI